ncbi:MAG: DUF4446 domain-containing protein [Firmicutes bacterium HGW-Firmicutes-12]|jgi:hypothetical protein|nr:MAG: DUF4446 domain-containing protein [Firmicutes bacterium HGW-Firmicutes-12]
MEIISIMGAQHIDIIILILSISYLIGIILLAVNIIRNKRLSRMYKILTTGAEAQNLEQIICKQTKVMEDLIEKIKIYDKRLIDVERLARKSIHKVDLLRFNAFNEMGGDLSFALAMLNQQGDGIVLSSIYGREDARTYAKAIKKGQASQQLSIEEEKVIASALQNRSN